MLFLRTRTGAVKRQHDPIAIEHGPARKLRARGKRGERQLGGGGGGKGRGTQRCSSRRTTHCPSNFFACRKVPATTPPISYLSCRSSRLAGLQHRSTGARAGATTSQAANIDLASAIFLLARPDVEATTKITEATGTAASSMEAEVQEAPVCPPPVPKPKATIITTTVESTPAATESQTQAGASPNGGAQPKREPSTDRKTIGVKDRKTRFSPMTGFFSNRMNHLIWLHCY